MKSIRPLIAGSLVVLTACAPHNDLTNVEPLSTTEPVEQRTTETGLSMSLAPANVFEAFGRADGDRSFHADIVFYETVLSYGPIADPRPLFLLSNAYIVANQQEYGISFLERMLRRYEDSM